MPPPDTGWTRAVHTLGPKKGADTWESRTFKRGDEKDWKSLVLDAGR